MKLYINESNYLSEDIEAVRKYYPNIEDSVFNTLIQLDPTYRGNQSLGKYGKWLLNLYNKGNLSEDEFNEVPDLLNQFTNYRNRIQNKDLNSYKSLDALADVLTSVIDDDSMLTNRQKVRFLKNVKSGKVKTDAEDAYDIVLDTPNFIVYVPNTHEASMKLGKGTEWCTAHENPDWYNKYTKNNGKLYIIKNKETGERWQYSDETGDFLDENDEQFDVQKLIKQDENLSKFFEKLLGVNYYSFDGTWVYDGRTIPDNIKLQITKIIISDNVTTIFDNAFRDCEFVSSIYIPNTVTTIGESAFENCGSLKTINIPNSVTIIDGFAFSRCQELKSITIPDSVSVISEHLFRGCKNLESINLPNSITLIGGYAFSFCTHLRHISIPDGVARIKEYAFFGCTNLTSVNIPNSVTDMNKDVFTYCDNVTIHTNNEYIKEYCKENKIPVKPLNNNESYKKPFKLHIKESISGRIEDTNERCIMEPTGYWVGANGRKITSYERVDKEVEYNDAGEPVHRQYSMDRQHRFWAETEDEIKNY